MKLYDFHDSGNGYKVRLLCAFLGLPYDYIEKDITAGETRTPEFLAKNPNGRIPLLELDDGVTLVNTMTDTVLDRAGVKGYTIISNLSGKGSHGFHEGHLMFNEDDVLIMIIAAVPEELVEPIIEGFAPLFSKHSGVVFISDIQVTRLVKFKD